MRHLMTVIAIVVGYSALVGCKAHRESQSASDVEGVVVDARDNNNFNYVIWVEEIPGQGSKNDTGYFYVCRNGHQGHRQDVARDCTSWGTFSAEAFFENIKIIYMALNKPHGLFDSDDEKALGFIRSEIGMHSVFRFAVDIGGEPSNRHMSRAQQTVHRKMLGILDLAWSRTVNPSVTHNAGMQTQTASPVTPVTPVTPVQPVTPVTNVTNSGTITLNDVSGAIATNRRVFAAYNADRTAVVSCEAAGVAAGWTQVMNQYYCSFPITAPEIRTCFTGSVRGVGGYTKRGYGEAYEWCATLAPGKPMDWVRQNQDAIFRAVMINKSF